MVIAIFVIIRIIAAKMIATITIVIISYDLNDNGNNNAT